MDDMQEFSGVLGFTLRMKAQVDSSSRGRKDFFCREEKRKAAWGHTGGPRKWCFPGSGWKLCFIAVGGAVSQVQMFPRKENCLLGQLLPSGASCSPSFN
jgi:hypothetical protein